MTFDEAITEFGTHLRASGFSECTIEAYDHDLRSLFGFARRRSVADPRAVDLDLLRAWLRDHARTCGAASLQRAVACLRTWQRWLARKGLLAGTPPAEQLAMPRVAPRLPVVLPIERMHQLMHLPDVATDAGARDAAMLEVLYGSGLRAAELCALDAGDVRERTSLAVTGKGKKGRLVPMGIPCVRALGRWIERRTRLAPPSAALFVCLRRKTRMTRRTLHRIVRGYGDRLGIEGLHPHALRHACATHMLAGGADLRAIQELLGHEHIGATERYLWVVVDDLKRIYERAHPLAKARPRQLDLFGPKTAGVAPA